MFREIIFLILFQMQVDSTSTPGELLLDKFYPRELIETCDSIYFEILSSVDTTNVLWEWFFGNRVKDALWNNEKLRNQAIKNYVEKGEQVFFLPFLDSQIWEEIQRKRIEYLNSKKIAKVKNYIFKKRLEEY